MLLVARAQGNVPVYSRRIDLTIQAKFSEVSRMVKGATGRCQCAPCWYLQVDVTHAHGEPNLNATWTFNPNARRGALLRGFSSCCPPTGRPVEAGSQAGRAPGSPGRGSQGYHYSLRYTHSFRTTDIWAQCSKLFSAHAEQDAHAILAHVGLVAMPAMKQKPSHTTEGTRPARPGTSGTISVHFAESPSPPGPTGLRIKSCARECSLRRS
jgi:hypothetical protein